MIDTDKLAFKEMVNAVYTIYNKPLPEKEMLRIWWHKLERFDFATVGRAFDSWTDAPNKMPQPAEIIQLCKPREVDYYALPAPINYEENKKNVDKLNQFIADRLKPKTNYRSWIDRVLENPQNFPEFSVSEAEKASKREVGVI